MSEEKHTVVYWVSYLNDCGKEEALEITSEECVTIEEALVFVVNELLRLKGSLSIDKVLELNVLEDADDEV